MYVLNVISKIQTFCSLTNVFIGTHVMVSLLISKDRLCPDFGF